MNCLRSYDNMKMHTIAYFTLSAICHRGYITIFIVQYMFNEGDFFGNVLEYVVISTSEDLASIHNHVDKSV